MRALFRIVRRVGLFALAGLILATPAVGQTGLATVTGLVSDSSGAAVPGVTVTATNQATNIAYTGITNGAGNYVITSVPIGEYVISNESKPSLYKRIDTIASQCSGSQTV